MRKLSMNACEPNFELFICLRLNKMEHIKIVNIQHAYKSLSRNTIEFYRFRNKQPDSIQLILVK